MVCESPTLTSAAASAPCLLKVLLKKKFTKASYLFISSDWVSA